MNSIIHLKTPQMRTADNKNTAQYGSQQKIIFLRHVQWMEVNENILRIKMIHDDQIQTLMHPDPSITKRVFYDVLKDVRASDGKVFEL